MAHIVNNELAIIATLKHFVSKEALDIKVLNGEIIGLLVGHGFIKTPTDLFSLNQAQPTLLTIMPVNVVEDILSSVEGSRHTTLARFIFALNIPTIGYMSSKRIAIRFRSIEAVMDASIEEIKSVNHVGQAAATKAHNFFAQACHREQVKKLLDAGIILTH